ncbi:hypothetical protein MC885_016007 [Smutsia gigantea]|nr:hypothetical protein MC885_016007 [Smutsia gigantea]
MTLLLPPTPLSGFQGARGDGGGSSRNRCTGPFGKKAKAQEVGNQPSDRPQEAPWTDFCDFRDITHVVLKERHISVHCHARLGTRALLGGGVPVACGACLTSPRLQELTLPSWAAALSLVSQVDGYFRLAAISSHYLCHKVAHPGLVMSIQDGIHFPWCECRQGGGWQGPNVEDINKWREPIPSTEAIIC